MVPTVNLQETHSIHHLPAFSLLISMQRWHCKIHSPESSHHGSSACNEMHRWCMTRCVTKHPPPKWLQEASSAAFFHIPIQELWIQFKCKVTKKTRHLCLRCKYSTCSWAWRGSSASTGATDHTDRSIGSDWLLDPLGADLMRMDHPFLLSSNILLTSFSLFLLLLRFSVVELQPRRMSLLSLFSHKSNTSNTFCFWLIKRSEAMVKFYYWDH